MSIRWNIRDKASGEIHIIDAPVVCHKRSDANGKAIYGSFIDPRVEERLKATVALNTTVGGNMKDRRYAKTVRRPSRGGPSKDR